MGDMKTLRIAAGAAIIAAIVATAALAATTIRFIAGGHAHSVKAVQVGGAWYVSADDVAHALGNGASFDASKRTLYASASDRSSQMHTVDKAGGGFATDGTIAARLVSAKSATSFQGNAPDPGAHFVMALVQLKNVSSDPVPMYKTEATLVSGSQHLNDGQWYDQDGHELTQENVGGGQTVTYLAVFELNDGVTADAILLHPPFAPTTAPIDILLKL